MNRCTLRVKHFSRICLLFACSGVWSVCIAIVDARRSWQGVTAVVKRALEVYGPRYIAGGSGGGGYSYDVVNRVRSVSAQQYEAVQLPTRVACISLHSSSDLNCRRSPIKHARAPLCGRRWHTNAELFSSLFPSKNSSKTK